MPSVKLVIQVSIFTRATLALETFCNHSIVQFLQLAQYRT